MRRVRICAEDELAGQDKCLLAEHLMADAAAHLEEVANALLLHEAADLGVILRVLGRRRGHGMVERDGDALGDQHAFLAELLPNAANGGGVVVAEHDVRPRIDHLADFDSVEPGRTRQRFLRKCLSAHSCFS